MFLFEMGLLWFSRELFHSLWWPVALPLRFSGDLFCPFGHFSLLFWVVF